MNRSIALAFAFSLVALTAAAQEFIVVSSTDPAIRKGQAFEAGQKVTVATGKAFTAMRASGEVLTFRAAAGGVTLPAAKGAAADQWRIAALKSLVQPPPEGRTFGVVRSTGCPKADELRTLPIILYALDAGCEAEARVAFETFTASEAAKAAQ